MKNDSGEMDGDLHLGKTDYYDPSDDDVVADDNNDDSCRRVAVGASNDLVRPLVSSVERARPVVVFAAVPPV